MLRRSLRLSEEKDIVNTIRSRQYTGQGETFKFIARDNGKDRTRCAIVVSSKMGKSVERNRIKRTLKAALIKIYDKISKNVDIVFYPKSSILAINKAKIEKDLCISLGAL